MEIYKCKERCTLGWSKVAALLQLTTTPRRRWTHSAVEKNSSSLSADDYPRVTKTEADEKEDGHTLGLRKVAAPFQLTISPE